MKVIVKSTDVIMSENKSEDGTTKRYSKQMCLLDNGGDYPLPFKISIPEGRPYPPGTYRFSDQSFRQNRFGGLEFAPYDMSLVPLK